MTFPSPERWLAGAGTVDLWPALPYWDSAIDLFARVRALETPDRLGPALAAAFAEAFLHQVAATSRSALLDAIDHDGSDVTAMSEQDLWAYLRRAGDKWGRNSLGHQKHRSEHLINVYAAAARNFAGHLRSERSMRGWVSDMVERCDGARLLGDVHSRGCVVALYDGQVPMLMYKPRSMAPDRLLASAVADLRERAPSTVPGLLDHVDRGTHGWQRYGRFAQPSDTEDYYRRFGGLIATSVVLQIADLHHENVKCVGGLPVILDSECSLTKLSRDVLVPQGQSLYRSIFGPLNTLLTPNWSTRLGQGDPTDPSALGSVGEVDRADVVRELRRENGRLYWEFSESSVRPVRPTLPQTSDPQSMPYEGHQDAILSGFDEAWDALNRSRARWRDYIGEGLAVRVLVRSTSYYTSMLESSAEAVVPPHSLLELGSADSSLAEWFREAETVELGNGVVPVFELSFPDGTLRSGSGASLRMDSQHVNDCVAAFAQVPSSEKVNGWRRAHRSVIESSLSLGCERGGAGQGEPSSVDRLVAWDGDLGGRQLDLERSISAISAWLGDRALSFGGSQTRWLSSEPTGRGRQRLTLTDSGLYSGRAGILLALAVAGREDAVAARLCEDLIDETERELDNSITDLDSSNSGPWRAGLAAGPVGVLLALLSGEQIRDRCSCSRRWTARLEALLPILGASADDHDLIEGAAGRAHGLLRIAELTGSAPVREAGLAVAESLVERVSADVARGAVSPGLAHGLSGVALAVSAFASMRPEWRELGEHLFRTEDRIAELGARYDEFGRAGSWCWGTAGRLESRLIARSALDLEPLRSRNNLAYVEGMSACHGLVGQAFLKRSDSYRQRFGERDAIEADALLYERLASRESLDLGPKFAPVPGLFAGIAGVLVYLCCLRDDASFSLASLRYEVTP